MMHSRGLLVRLLDVFSTNSISGSVGHILLRSYSEMESRLERLYRAEHVVLSEDFACDP